MHGGVDFKNCALMKIPQFNFAANFMHTTTSRFRMVGNNIKLFQFSYFWEMVKLNIALFANKIV